MHNKLFKEIIKYYTLTMTAKFNIIALLTQKKTIVDKNFAQVFEYRNVISHVSSQNNNCV